MRLALKKSEELINKRRKWRMYSRQEVTLEPRAAAKGSSLRIKVIIEAIKLNIDLTPNLPADHSWGRL